jgi:hypothetical protein
MNINVKARKGMHARASAHLLKVPDVDSTGGSYVVVTLQGTVKGKQMIGTISSHASRLRTQAWMSRLLCSVWWLAKHPLASRMVQQSQTRGADLSLQKIWVSVLSGDFGRFVWFGQASLPTWHNFIPCWNVIIHLVSTRGEVCDQRSHLLIMVTRVRTKVAGPSDIIQWNSSGVSPWSFQLTRYWV